MKEGILFLFLSIYKEQAEKLLYTVEELENNITFSGLQTNGQHFTGCQWVPAIME